MLSDRERAFLTRRRIGHLATSDRSGTPHLVPVCFAAGDDELYTGLDEKPKSGRLLKRVQNILENPNVAFLVDHYDEDWSHLGWLRLDGAAEVLSNGPEFELSIQMLRDRYEQYSAMRLSAVIAIRILRARSWGDLSS